MSAINGVLLAQKTDQQPPTEPVAQQRESNQNQPEIVDGKVKNRQAQIEKLLHILQLLANSNQQQQEQILQRMTFITADHKQQLLQKAQALKQQMLQQQQQQLLGPERGQLG